MHRLLPLRRIAKLWRVKAFVEWFRGSWGRNQLGCVEPFTHHRGHIRFGLVAFHGVVECRLANRHGHNAQRRLRRACLPQWIRVLGAQGRSARAKQDRQPSSTQSSQKGEHARHPQPDGKEKKWRRMIGTSLSLVNGKLGGKS